MLYCKKIKIFITLLIISSAICAEAIQDAHCAEEMVAIPSENSVDQSYIYFSGELGYLNFPGFNIGVLKQVHNHGFGVEAGVGLLLPAYRFPAEHFTLRYLYYPRPSLTSQHYFGFSVGGVYIMPMIDTLLLSPRIFYGKEFLSSKNRRRFWEVFIGCYYAPQAYEGSIPTFGFRYGFAF